ncbi:oxaloacetate decarboxylase subunit alpha [Kineothrix sp. MB12-C1]|uniref:oxaloacetate decarboxylase subunit alpha n=1 Tax=Kineothrix sp. MB12-C1 TaxID=3070215 RepID=UPI0027D306BE|nr:oxaloacetate decarboxylase subunit alpha [Kineothrix sp. MB12-C1]WMC92411.1 oxaloacetate decarboxylase subunit alpha [Kineothrix sp. MB12-C1]
MSEQVKKPIGIVETVLRDAHQSLIATRMPTEMMLPIIDKMDKVGYHAVECWGGATFDASLRFLKEDPWERLRKLKDGFKNTKLQMLFRGQNILGYRPYADDVVDYFVEKSIANGIDIIRIFDCLNDLRNLEAAVNSTSKIKGREGRGHAQVALSYTLGDAYTLDYWVDMAKKVEEMGADSICIKDMAGLLLPYEATNMISAMKGATSLPIELHTHYTSGVASMTYLKAVEAGADIIDCAISPMAMGTSQPATEVMVETFKGTPYDTGYDQNILADIADYFRPYRDEWLSSGLLNPKVMGVDIKTLLYQVPGGMLSNMVSQLKEQNAEDKYYDVLREIPEVRKDLGEPPLVTPSSQIVGTQAVFNVLMGERYKMATKETKAVLRGEYGQTVKPMSQEVIDKVIPGEERITCRPADLIENELDKLEAEMREWKQQDEDVLSYALFPQVAVEFFKYRQAQQEKVDMAQADTKNAAYPV